MNKFITFDRLVVNLEHAVTMEYDDDVINIETIRNERIIITNDEVEIEDSSERPIFKFKQRIDVHATWLLILGKVGNNE